MFALENVCESVAVDGPEFRVFLIDGGWKAIFPRTDNITEIGGYTLDTYLELSGRTLGSSLSSHALFL